jgi:hypothetical protein
MRTAVIMDPGFRRDDEDKKSNRGAVSRVGARPVSVMCGCTPTKSALEG